MLIFPAIDLFGGNVVRLFKGDYDRMTVYGNNPVETAKNFHAQGAEYLHVVDLEGAKSGETPNLDIIRAIVSESGLNVEVGGGIRSDAVVKKYIDAGVMRVILGTAAVTDRDFLVRSVKKYGEKIAVGVDIRDGNVAIRGWTETTTLTCFDFFSQLCNIGVKTVICTDISKDGVLGGTNLSLYRELSEKFPIDIVASGGVSTISDIESLSAMNIYGAILGKALYAGSLNLSQAISAAKKEQAV